MPIAGSACTPFGAGRRPRGLLSLVDGSRLRLRLPSEEIAPYLALAGSQLDVGGHRLRVGIPRAESLVPAGMLAARLVTIRHALEPDAFLSAVRRELTALEITGEPNFVTATRPGWEGTPLRRVLRIKERRVVGYALRVSGLTAAESIRLQESGLGGRRRFGCGVFVPVRRPAVRSD